MGRMAMAGERSGGYERLAFTAEEAAELLGISRSQIFRLVDLGELQTVTIGRSRRVTRRQLEEFLRRIEASGGTGRLP